MRLLTHNTMKNNSADAKGKGFPLWITAAEVRVDDSSEPMTDGQIAFVKGVLPTLEWSALVKVRTRRIILVVAMPLFTPFQCSTFRHKGLANSRCRFYYTLNRQQPKWVSRHFPQLCRKSWQKTRNFSKPCTTS